MLLTWQVFKHYAAVVHEAVVRLQLLPLLLLSLLVHNADILGARVLAIREQALGVLNGRGWLLQVLYEVLGLRLSAHSVAAAVALLWVLRLHKLLAERSICVALNNRLEPGG